jgi:hypothetical protein
MALPGMFERYGELLLLELEPNGANALYAYNVTNVVDCLDRRNTQGLWLDEARLAIEDSYAFHPEAVRGAGIFRVPEQRSTVFVTSPILAMIRGSALTGFSCPEVWRSP